MLSWPEGQSEEVMPYADGQELLPPEHVFQESGSKNCGPAVLEMVGRLTGRPDLTVENFLKDNNLSPEGSTTYLPGLAHYIHVKEKENLDTALFTFDNRALPSMWKGLSSFAIINNLEKRLPERSSEYSSWDHNALYMQKYISAGGTVKIIAPPDESDLQRFIDWKWHIIASVDETMLWWRNARGGAQPDGHAILIAGRDGHNFEIYDPYPTELTSFHGVYPISGSELVSAITAWNPQLLLVRKNEVQ